MNTTLLSAACFILVFGALVIATNSFGTACYNAHDDYAKKYPTGKGIIVSGLATAVISVAIIAPLSIYIAVYHSDKRLPTMNY